MNSFTDIDPTFPYQSSEASKQLGLPHAPEVHFAITKVAELLMLVAQASSMDEPMQRTTVLRVASGAVLYGWPLSDAEQEVRVRLALPLREGSQVPQPWISNEKDWLSEAADRLRREGIHVNPSFQRQRSNYGWRHLENPSPAGQDGSQ